MQKLRRNTLQAGANPDALDSESAKPIHAAAFSGHAPIVELLIDMTSPRQGEKWSVEALMAETSSAGSASSPEQASQVYCDSFAEVQSVIVHKKCTDLQIQQMVFQQ